MHVFEILASKKCSKEFSLVREDCTPNHKKPYKESKRKIWKNKEKSRKTKIQKQRNF